MVAGALLDLLSVGMCIVWGTSGLCLPARVNPQSLTNALPKSSRDPAQPDPPGSANKLSSGLVIPGIICCLLC